MSAIDEIAAKLDRLVRESDCSTSDLTPLSDDSIAEFESQHRVTLPSEYRNFLMRCGDTNIGPGNCFVRMRDAVTENSHKQFLLSAPFLGLCAPAVQQLPEDKQWDAFGPLAREWDAIPKDHGVLNISDYGCAIYGVLILNGPYRGTVWTFGGDAAYYGPFGGSEPLHDPRIVDWEPTDSPKDYSFLEWYAHWLDAESELKTKFGSH